MKLKYNAPATLTFTFICSLVLLLNQLVFPGLIQSWFMVPGRSSFNPAFVPDYLRLFTHIIGHSDWSHLLGNFAFILLLGPLLEQNYGSVSVLIMMLITALVTGILNVLFFNTGLLGASGIVFMMILLSSFTNINQGEIPLTFILVMFLFLGKEVIGAFESNNVSEFAHIIGGLCGGLFGFFNPFRKV